MKLYAFALSSSSYRARIVLHLKDLAFETVAVSLPKREQFAPDYFEVNPQQRVPSLELDDGTILTQSLAIIGYLDETYPAPPIYPAGPIAKAKAMAVALAVAADIQPLSNPSVTNHLREVASFDQRRVDEWMALWTRAGLVAVERLIDGTHYCFGTEPTIADVCLVPQVFNAHRFNIDLSDLPKVNAVFDVASAHPAFIAAHPSRQSGFA